MTYASRATATIDRLTGHFGGGETLTLRRGHTLTNRNTGAAITSLSVNGTVSIGGSSLDLDAINLDEGGLLPVGITLTHDGNTYTVATADVRVNSSGVLSGVAITPVLASEATDDDTVTITTAYADYALPFAQSGYSAEDIAAGVDRTDMKLIVSGLGAGATFNTETDSAIVNGQVVTVKDVELYRPDGKTVAGLVLRVAA